MPFRVDADFTQFKTYTEQMEVNLNLLRNTETFRTELNDIGAEMVKIAKGFVRRNNSIDKGDLYRSIKWEPTNKGVRLYADARNKGYPYPRSVEYGFHFKGKKYIKAKPFIRPALRVGSELSQKELGDAMLTILRGKSLGRKGRTPRLKFGNKLGKQSRSMKELASMKIGRSWSGESRSGWDLR